MKKLVLVTLFALAACGGKSQGTTTPSNTGGPMGSGAMGGTSYGGATTGSAMSGSAMGSAMAPNAGGDPCGG